MSVPSGPGAASSSGASGPAGGGRGGLNGLRRKSLRNSIFLSAAAQPAAATVGGLGGGQAPQGHPYGPLHEAVERKVEQFVTKVLQHNDRYAHCNLFLITCMLVIVMNGVVVVLYFVLASWTSSKKPCVIHRIHPTRNTLTFCCALRLFVDRSVVSLLFCASPVRECQPTSC